VPEEFEPLSPLRPDVPPPRWDRCPAVVGDSERRFRANLARTEFDPHNALLPFRLSVLGGVGHQFVHRQARSDRLVEGQHAAFQIGLKHSLAAEAEVKAAQQRV
jgi:hypothetical protein